jgi:four helix bundle protein
MSRDPYKLEAFVIADSLIVDLYRATREFPAEERFALQSQIRRAAVSVAANLVEGCARRSERDYLHFVSIAIGSASEVRYLIRLAVRLGFVETGAGDKLAHGYGRVSRALQALTTAILSGRGPRSEVRGPSP